MRLSLLALVVAVGSAHADPTPFDALLAKTDDLAKEVAKLRGLPVKKAIPNDVVDRDELRRRLVAEASTEKAKTENAAEGLALARWGMIPLATDYPTLMIDLLTEQIAGYYDPETKKLTISKSAADDLEWAELVLAHELEHGLQDQAFDLQKFEDLPATEGDALTARRALVEGDGIGVMLEVMFKRQKSVVPWQNPLLASAVDKEISKAGTGGIDQAPLAVRESLIFSYRGGLAFVAALRRHHAWSAIDAVFAKPPRSTEQILHPERYLAGELPVAIALEPPAALAGYTIAHSTVWGELMFSLFLRSRGLDPVIAATAADGWGGDRTIILAKPGETRPEKTVAISRSEWDSEPDAIEAHEAAVKVLESSIPGTVLDESPLRTRWFGIDGTVSWVERKGGSLVIVLAAPAWAADALAADVWTASKLQPRR